MRHALPLAASGQSCTIYDFGGCKGDDAAVTRMLDRGTNHDARGEYGSTPLPRAEREGRRETACLPRERSE